MGEFKRARRAWDLARLHEEFATIFAARALAIRRTIWANGDREQVIAIRARALSRQPTLAPARQGLRSMPNRREHDSVNTR